MKNNKVVYIIGVPYLYGKDDTRKTNSPDVIRKSGIYKAFELAGIGYQDKGSIEIGKIQKKHPSLSKYFNYFDQVVDISRLVSQKVGTSLSESKIPLILGGDHSVSIGALLEIPAWKNDVGVIYFDTHGDFHTSQTTPSGRMHGMTLALSLGLDKKFSKFYNPKSKFIDRKNVVLFGAQKFDDGEKENVIKNISLIDMPFIIEYGIGKATEKLLNQINTKNVYISLDMDVVNKQYAPGTDMAIDSALTYRELIYVLEKISEKYNVIGMDVVEISTERDIENKTVELAIEAITTALGKRIGEYERYMDKITVVNNVRP